MRDLILGPLGGGFAEHRQAVVFTTPVKALAHMCDHLLTPPEMHLWVALVPRLASIAGSRSSRINLGRSMWKAASGEVQNLYDDWREAARQEADAARRLDWAYRDVDSTIYFSPRGVKIVVGPHGLRSIYFVVPRASVLPEEEPLEDASPDSRTVEQRLQNPFPREGRLLDVPYGGADALRQSATVDPDREEFRRFRRAVDAVRCEYRSALYTGRATPSAFALLQEARRDRLTWRALLDENYP